MTNDQPLVLIVEDDQRMAGTIASIVQLLGYSTRIANTSRAAVVTARQVKPDMVLCDLNLPDVDGFELIRFFQQDPLIEKMPVIFISAESDPGIIQEAHNIGAADYLVKPVGIPDLESAISAVLNEEN